MTKTAEELREVIESALEEHDEMLRAEAAYSDQDNLTVDPKSKKKGSTLPEGSLDGIVRHNGETYFPRALEGPAKGTTDVQFIQTAYENEIPVLLYGPPGTGKTALLEAALPGLVTMVGTAETETSDFIGSYIQTPEGFYEWVDGPLLVAMEGGHPMLVDEIALVDARVMSIVYSVMDGRRELPVTANPSRGVVTAQPGFVVYGACNPNVPGAVMSDALLSRFGIHVEVTSDWDLATKLKVGTKVITAARNLNAKADAHELTAAPQIREAINFAKVSEIYGEAVAIHNFVAAARPEDRDAYVEVMKSVFGDSTVKALTF